MSLRNWKVAGTIGLLLLSAKPAVEAQQIDTSAALSALRESSSDSMRRTRSTRLAPSTPNGERSRSRRVVHSFRATSSRFEWAAKADRWNISLDVIITSGGLPRFPA